MTLKNYIVLLALIVGSFAYLCGILYRQFHPTEVDKIRSQITDTRARAEATDASNKAAAEILNIGNEMVNQ